MDKWLKAGKESKLRAAKPKPLDLPGSAPYATQPPSTPEPQTGHCKPMMRPFTPLLPAMAAKVLHNLAFARNLRFYDASPRTTDCALNTPSGPTPVDAPAATPQAAHTHCGQQGTEP